MNSSPLTGMACGHFSGKIRAKSANLKKSKVILKTLAANLKIKTNFKTNKINNKTCCLAKIRTGAC